MGVATTHAPTDQKIGPLGGPFGLTAISKLCFRNFPAFVVDILHFENFFANNAEFKSISTRILIFSQNANLIGCHVATKSLYVSMDMFKV